MVDPIENRYKEEAAREKATRNLLNCIQEYQMAVRSLPPSARDVVGSLEHKDDWI